MVHLVHNKKLSQPEKGLNVQLENMMHNDAPAAMCSLHENIRGLEEGKGK